ncbi:MAG: FecR family protein [Roseibacillus sp.]|jgi:ferric-dicitrate binding protein FerR (iron transport regulator)
MPESTEQTKKLDALLARVVEETITAEEFTELETLLDGNPEGQQRYLHYLALHADLQESDATSAIVPMRSQGGRRWSSVAMLGAAAAAAALVVAIFLLSRTGPGAQSPVQVESQAPTPIATIGELNGSVAWTGDGGQVIYNLDVGDSIGGGTLETLATNSWAEIVFLDGSSVWVSGPASLTLSEGKEGKLIHLRRGDLSVDVSPQPAGKPLRLVTPTAEAEVLGTQFNVTAGSASTRLTVNRGLVRVTRLVDGRVQEVPADRFVVAALEQETEFKATLRGEYAAAWQSELPRDARRGRWESAAEDKPGALRAQAHIFRGDHGERVTPILLHTVVVGPSAAHLPPILLTKGARFRIKGRLARSHFVNFGFGTHRVRGGFSGKFTVSRKIEFSEESKGEFEIELALDEFSRTRSRFPESSIGHEIAWLWIQTVKEDAGLEVISVELVGSE